MRNAMDATTMPQVVKPSILRILETMTRVNMTWNVAVMDKMTRHSVVDTLVLEPVSKPYFWEVLVPF